MKLTHALGLGSDDERVPVPVSTWVPAGIVVAAPAVAVLLLTGAAVGWAVPVGLAVGLFLAVPLGAVVTLRFRKRRIGPGSNRRAP